MVWIIRRFQPDVVITRFPVTGEGGHGHHTSSAILANEAYEAAADPKRFPEQLKYVKPWQVKRVMWNTFNFGTVNTIKDDQFRIDVGGYNPSLGASYGEIAASSRSQHKSQGFGMPASRGESLEWFTTTKGTAPVNHLMDGVQTGWERVENAKDIPTMVDAIEKNFDPIHPEKSVPALVQLYNRIRLLPDQYWKKQKLSELTELLLQCSGLYAEAFVRVPAAAPADSLQMQFSLISRLAPGWTLEKVSVAEYNSELARKLEINKPAEWSYKIKIPASQPFTQPYWLANQWKKGRLL
ncbi:MAG: hypothetical protein NVV59_11400 [Chitinophagaceae bacterium]|nr:hypothetical protein [Chitinophagaceae bacterium]